MKNSNDLFILICLLSITTLVTTPISICGKEEIAGKTSDDDENIYGFIIPVNISQSNDVQENIMKLVNELLREDIDVYWSTSPTKILSDELSEMNSVKNREYAVGIFIVSFSGKSDQDVVAVSCVYNYQMRMNVKIDKLLEPLTHIEVYKLVEPRIAYHDGYNVQSNVYSRVIENGGFTFIPGSFLSWDNISNRLNNESYDFNVFIWGTRLESNQDIVKNYLQVPANNAIRSFVAGGGGYIGSCYGAYEIAYGSWTPLAWIKPYCPKIPALLFPKFSTRIPLRALPGAGDLTVEIVDSNSPIAYGLPPEFKTYGYWGGPMFLGPKGNTKNVAVIKDIDTDTWYWDWETSDNIPESLIDAWVSFAKGKPIWVTTEFGQGKVIAFSNHVETSPYRGNCGSRVVYNAVLYAASQGPFIVDIQNKIALFSIEVNSNGPYNGYISEPIVFQGDISGGNPPYSWIWDFGEIEHSTEQNPVYSYNRVGEFDVILAVADNNGSIDVDTSTVSIHEVLNAKIELDWNELYTDFPIFFFAVVSDGFLPYNYHWNFGDGNTSTEQNPTHTYLEGGRYDYNLTVTDALNSSVTDAGTITIIDDENDNNFIYDENSSDSKLTIFAIAILLISIMGTTITALVFIIRK
jgi:PKD repeat protein